MKTYPLLILNNWLFPKTCVASITFSLLEKYQCREAACAYVGFTIPHGARWGRMVAALGLCLTARASGDGDGDSDWAGSTGRRVL